MTDQNKQAMPELPVAAYYNSVTRCFNYPPMTNYEPLVRLSDALTYAKSLRSALEAARAALEFVINTSNHFIPSYAYAESEAGCDLAHRLAVIYDKASAALSNTKEQSND